MPYYKEAKIHNFINKSFTPFMLFSAVFTMSAGVLAIAPELIISLFLIPFSIEYQLLIQHWGLTTFIIGLLLLLSIKIKSWRMPIMLLAFVEKVYMVILYLYLPTQYVAGFQNVAIIDTLISLYFLYYFIAYKKSFYSISHGR